RESDHVEDGSRQHRVKAKSAKEQAEFWNQYSKKLRESRKGDGVPVQASEHVDRLKYELVREAEQQTERDRNRYRRERWAEWLLIFFSFAMGPGLIGTGRGVLWGLEP